MPAPGSPPPDTTPPSVPTGVAARAVSPTSADLSWTASSDTVGVAGYTVRRDGVAVATVPAAATSYRDTALAAERRYAWTVEAFDAAGNRSSPSAAATATTPVRPAQQPQPARRPAPRAGTGPRVHRGVLPGLAGRGRRRLQHGGRSLVAEACDHRGSGRSCSLTGGRWRSPYDGKYRTRSGTLVVDHVVPLREAWRSGARAGGPRCAGSSPTTSATPRPWWRSPRRRRRAKAGREPQDWLPRPAYRCTYVADWVAVKWRWRLAVDPAERRFLTRTLRGCGWPQVRAPGRAVP